MVALQARIRSAVVGCLIVTGAWQISDARAGGGHGKHHAHATVPTQALPKLQTTPQQTPHHHHHAHTPKAPATPSFQPPKPHSPAAKPNDHHAGQSTPKGAHGTGHHAPHHGHTTKHGQASQSAGSAANGKPSSHKHGTTSGSQSSSPGTGSGTSSSQTSSASSANTPTPAASPQTSVPSTAASAAVPSPMVPAAAAAATSAAAAAVAAERPEPKVPETIAELVKDLTAPGPGPVAAAGPPSGVGAAPRGAKPTIRRERIAAPELKFAPPEILAPRLSPKSLDRAEALGFTNNGSISLPGLSLAYTRLLVPEGMSAQQGKELLRREVPEQAAEVNHTYALYQAATVDGSGSEILSSNAAPMATPCGTDRCFGAHAIRWQSRLQSCARSVSVGIIDTGIDESHPAFADRRIEVRREKTALLGAARAKAPDWHGTGVTALLAGNLQSATPGLIPDAKYLVADVFFPDADGQPVSNTSNLLEALNWLEGKGVQVINMSLAGPKDDLLKSAIAALSRKGIIIVAAVGNEGPAAPPTYPSGYDEVIAVTAVTKDMTGYRYANRGKHVDVAAPGVGIWTAMPGGSGAYQSGTSFAAPFVTAVVASMYGSLPSRTKADVLARLNYVDLGTAGRDPIYGRGLVLAPSSCAPAAPENSPSAFLTTVSVKKP